MKVCLEPANSPSNYPLLLSTCICCSPSSLVDSLVYSLSSSPGDKRMYQGRSFYSPSISVNYIDLSLEGRCTHGKS